MLSLLKLDLTAEQVAKLRSVLYYTGLPIDARSVTDEILAQEGGDMAARVQESRQREVKTHRTALRED